jgi:hypothetical protein
MLPLTIQQLHELLLHRECPWSSVLRTSTTSFMLVQLFRQFAAQRGYDPDSAESAMTAFVAERGGGITMIVPPRLAPAKARFGIVKQHPAAPKQAWALPQCSPGGAVLVALVDDHRQ